MPQPRVLTLGIGMPTVPGLKDRHSDKINPRPIVDQTGFRVCGRIVAHLSGRVRRHTDTQG